MFYAHHHFFSLLSIFLFLSSAVIFIPRTILIFCAGYAFTYAAGGNTFQGSITAIFSCYLGSCIGAVIAFVRARYMMRDLIHLFANRYPLVRAADRGK